MYTSIVPEMSSNSGFFLSPLDGLRSLPPPPSPAGGQSKWRKWEECWECLAVEAPPKHRPGTEALSREEVAAMASIGPLRSPHRRARSTVKHSNYKTERWNKVGPNSHNHLCLHDRTRSPQANYLVKIEQRLRGGQLPRRRRETDARVYFVHALMMRYARNRCKTESLHSIEPHIIINISHITIEKIYI